MDSVVVGVLGGIVMLIGVIAYTFAQAAEPSKTGESVEVRKQSKLDQLRNRMQEKLLPYIDDKVAMQVHKKKLLQAFSAELEMNVMFDSDEKREMIAELAAFEPTPLP